MGSFFQRLDRLFHLSVRQVKCPDCAGTGIAGPVEQMTPTNVCQSCGGHGWVTEKESRTAASGSKRTRKWWRLMRRLPVSTRSTYR